MTKEYLVQLSPLCETDFLNDYGEVFYQADCLSNVIGISSSLDLIDVLEADQRVKFVRDWNLSYEI